MKYNLPLPSLPEGMSAVVELPATKDSSGVFVDGKPAPATKHRNRWVLHDEVRGAVHLEVKSTQRKETE